MIYLYNLILYTPLFNGLIFLHKVILGHDLGVAIIILTILIKFILFFPSLSSIKQQRSMQEIQPKIDEIKKKYKDNREQLGKEMMRIYKESKVNPFSSCLPLLIQLPILIALYQVFIGGLKTDPNTGILIIKQLDHLYRPLREIYATTVVSPQFLGFINLLKPNYIFGILAGACQFWQSRMLLLRQPPKVPGAQDEGMAAQMNRQMVYFMPIITVVFGMTFPAGLTLYWIISTLFMVGQQYYFLRRDRKQKKEPAL